MGAELVWVGEGEVSVVELELELELEPEPAVGLLGVGFGVGPVLEVEGPEEVRGVVAVAKFTANTVMGAAVSVNGPVEVCVVPFATTIRVSWQLDWPLLMVQRASNDSLPGPPLPSSSCDPVKRTAVGPIVRVTMNQEKMGFLVQLRGCSILYEVPLLTR